MTKIKIAIKSSISIPDASLAKLKYLRYIIYFTHVVAAQIAPTLIGGGNKNSM